MRRLSERLDDWVTRKTYLAYLWTGKRDYSRYGLYYRTPAGADEWVATYPLDQVDAAEAAMDYLNQYTLVDSDHAKWLLKDMPNAVESNVDEAALAATLAQIITKVEGQYQEHVEAEETHRAKRKQLKAKLTTLQNVVGMLTI